MQRGLYPSAHNNIAYSTHTKSTLENSRLIILETQARERSTAFSKKKQEEKSHDMQKLTPNRSKHNFDVTSTNFKSVILPKKR